MIIALFVLASCYRPPQYLSSVPGTLNAPSLSLTEHQLEPSEAQRGSVAGLGLKTKAI